jgi:hypothetical protein
MPGGHNTTQAHILVETEPASRRHENDPIERPFAVTPRRAWWMIGCGATRGYEHLAAGELDSYLDGRSRRITVASIERFVARRLAASGSGELQADLVAPAVRARKQQRSRRHAPGGVTGVVDTSNSPTKQAQSVIGPGRRARLVSALGKTKGSG